MLTFGADCPTGYADFGADTVAEGAKVGGQTAKVHVLESPSKSRRRVWPPYPTLKEGPARRLSNGRHIK